MKKLLFVVVASALTLSSCISKKDHEALQNKQKQTQQELLASKSAYEISDTERKSLGIQRKTAEAEGIISGDWFSPFRIHFFLRRVGREETVSYLGG